MSNSKIALSKWKDSKLGDIVQVSSGGTPSKNNPEYWNGDIPWISASSMLGHSFSTSVLKITNLGLSSGSKLADENSILLLVRGSMLWNKIPVGIATRGVAFNQDVKSLKISKNITSPKYLLSWFIANEEKLLSMVVGTGIGAGKLETSEIKNLVINHPPLPEQNRIVAVLETWDQYLEKLEEKIVSKKNIKKWLMQQLLTGETRLPGFSGKWEERSLSHYISANSGFGFPLQFQGKKNEQYPFYKVSDMNINGNEIVMRKCNNSISKNDLIKLRAKVIDKNAIIFPKIGAAIATNKKRKLSKPAVIDNNIMSIVTRNNCNSEYAYQWLLNRNLSRWVNSGGVPSMRKSSILMTKVYFPDIQEQSSIAEILTTADEEIATLESKRDIIVEQKKYLLNNLITGTIRTP